MHGALRQLGLNFVPRETSNAEGHKFPGVLRGPVVRDRFSESGIFAQLLGQAQTNGYLFATVGEQAYSKTLPPVAEVSKIYSIRHRVVSVVLHTLRRYQQGPTESRDCEKSRTQSFPGTGQLFRL
jgi:hypothetical protein